MGIDPVDQLIDMMNKRDPFGGAVENLNRTGTFEMTEDHLKLLDQMYVDWNDSAYDGAPAIGMKRPYGNSDMIGDVADILRGPFGKRSGYHEEREEYIRFDREGGIISMTTEDGRTLTAEDLLRIHRETHLALQIVLCTQDFKPGTFRKRHAYGALSWERVAQVAEGER